MRKRLLVIFMVLAFANFMFTAIAYAQDEIVEEETAVEEVVAEEVVPFEETAQSGGLEMFARKIVGSGLVDLFIQGGIVRISNITRILYKSLNIRCHTF